MAPDFPADGGARAGIACRIFAIGLEDSLLIGAIGVLDLADALLELREIDQLGGVLGIGFLLQLLLDLPQPLLQASLSAAGGAGAIFGSEPGAEARWK